MDALPDPASPSDAPKVVPSRYYAHLWGQREPLPPSPPEQPLFPFEEAAVSTAIALARDKPLPQKPPPPGPFEHYLGYRRLLQRIAKFPVFTSAEDPFFKPIRERFELYLDTDPNDAGSYFDSPGRCDIGEAMEEIWQFYDAHRNQLPPPAKAFYDFYGELMREALARTEKLEYPLDWWENDNYLYRLNNGISNDIPAETIPFAKGKQLQDKFSLAQGILAALALRHIVPPHLRCPYGLSLNRYSAVDYDRYGTGLTADKATSGYLMRLVGVEEESYIDFLHVVRPPTEKQLQILLELSRDMDSRRKIASAMIPGPTVFWFQDLISNIRECQRSSLVGFDGSFSVGNTREEYERWMDIAEKAFGERSRKVVAQELASAKAALVRKGVNLVCWAVTVFVLVIFLCTLRSAALAGPTAIGAAITVALTRWLGCVVVKIFE